MRTVGLQWALKVVATLLTTSCEKNIIIPHFSVICVYNETIDSLDTFLFVNRAFFLKLVKLVRVN